MGTYTVESGGSSSSWGRVAAVVASVAIVGAVVIALCVVLIPTTDKKPHIIFILADDLGLNDIGYNNGDVISPNLDQLAQEEGMILNYNYVQNLCSPSRSALLTGKYPFEIRMQHGVIQTDFPQCVPTNFPLLPGRLRDMGYRTMHAGKWHVGYCQEACLPNHRGYDKFWGRYLGEGAQFTQMNGEGFDFRNDTETYWKANGTHVTDLVKEAALREITSYIPGDPPLFLMLAFSAVHSPYEDYGRYVSLYDGFKGKFSDDRILLLAMMSHMDEAVGEVVAALKQTDMWQDTLLVFSSDNGGICGVGDNSPLRRCKASSTEGGTRVPGFVSGGRLAEKARGTINNGLLHIVDWAATFLRIAGVQDDDLTGLSGVDQRDMILNGGNSQRTEVLYLIDQEFLGDGWWDDQGPVNGAGVIRMGDYKLFWGNEGKSDGYGSNLTKMWDIPANQKLVFDPYTEGNCTDTYPKPNGKQRNSDEHDCMARKITEAKMYNTSQPDSGTMKLFNLKDDARETTDLAGDPAHAQLILDMKRRLVELMANYLPVQDGAFTADSDCDQRSDSIPVKKITSQ